MDGPEKSVFFFLMGRNADGTQYASFSQKRRGLAQAASKSGRARIHTAKEIASPNEDSRRPQ